MRRGEIWWASFADLRASGPPFRRPVVVIQSNSFNESLIDTVVVAVVTSDLALAAAPSNVFVGRSVSTLPDVSIVDVSQVLTIDKRLLTENVCRLPNGIMDSIDDGLRLILSL